MNETLEIILFMLLVISGQIFAIYQGRDGKTKDWPFSKETTISVCVLLIFQWVYICIEAARQSSIEEKRNMIKLGLATSVGIPLIIGTIWDWIYLKLIKMTEDIAKNDAGQDTGSG